MIWQIGVQIASDVMLVVVLFVQLEFKLAMEFLVYKQSLIVQRVTETLKLLQMVGLETLEI